MTETNQEEEVAFTTPMNGRDLASIVITGVVAGFVVWLIYWLLMRYLTPRLFCDDPTTSLCTSAPAAMDGVSLIIGAIVGLLGLIRLRSFRPLLVVLAVTVALGGLAQQADLLAWYWAALASAGLFAVAYALFAWVARIRAFWLALVVTVVLVVITRLALFS